MKKLLSYNDFEEHLKNSYTPSIDLKENVMNHVYNMQMGKINKKRIAVFLLIIVSTLFTAFATLTQMNIWQLFSKNNNLVYTYEKLTKERANEIMKNSYDISSYQRILNPGEAAAFVTINGNRNEVRLVQQPEIFHNLADLKKKADIEGIVKIPNGFSFSYGDVEYKLDPNIYNEIQRASIEARKKGEKIIKVDLKKLHEYDNAALLLSNGSINIKEEIFNNPDTKLSFSSIDDEKVEKLKIKDKVVLYISNNSTHKIIWVNEMNNGIKIEFTVYSSTSITKNELINIVKELNGI